MDKLMLNADEVADALDVSRTRAYAIIREMNEELKKAGYLTICGRVPRAFLLSKVYGGDAIGRD